MKKKYVSKVVIIEARQAINWDIIRTINSVYYVRPGDYIIEGFRDKDDVKVIPAEDFKEIFEEMDE